jgi:hypothetical protein
LFIGRQVTGMKRVSTNLVGDSVDIAWRRLGRKVFPLIKKTYPRIKRIITDLSGFFNDYRLTAAIEALYFFRNNLPGILPTWKVFF